MSIAGASTSAGPASSDYYRSRGWRRRRARAIRRAGGRCQACNSSDRLEAHHRTYERMGRERRRDITILCSSCHQALHAHWREIDSAWRETRRRVAQKPAFRWVRRISSARRVGAKLILSVDEPMVLPPMVAQSIRDHASKVYGRKIKEVELEGAE